MSPFQMIYPALNLAGASLYAFILFLILKMFFGKAPFRNHLAFSLISFSFCLILRYGFCFYKGLAPLAVPLPQDWILAVVLLFPGFFFLGSKREMLAVSVDFALQSKIDRFHQQKDEFLSMASHELRTPLSIISGFAEILVREKLGPLNDEQKRRVRKILMQSRRLNRIVDELLDLNRIRSGKVEVQRIVFDLVPVLKAAYDDHTDICEQQHLVFEDHVPDVIPDVIADLDRVNHIVVNLLNNAIKYTPPGGKISLEARYDEKSSFVEVSVADTGIGIDTEEQELVFNEFYRCNQATSRKYSGSGLGLAIVKQLAESIGGRVFVFSEGHGKGSRFVFTVPIAAKEKGSKPKAENPAAKRAA